MNAIEIEQLSIQFFNYTVFRNLNVAVPEKKYLAVIGPNGSGKSCLVRAMLGLLKPSGGSIRIEGKSPGEVPFEWMGYVPQIKTLDRTFPGKAIELVMTGMKRGWPWRVRKADQEKVEAALARVGALHLANRPIGKLSGGELQRVYLARCLIRQPRLILLDEPATGIDVTLIADMYRLLEEIQTETGATIVMVTHDLAAASYHADLVLLLNQEAIYFGPPRESLTEEHLRRTFGHTGHAHLMLGGTPHA